MAFRIGQGYDVHRLVEGRKLILGGVDIPFEKGVLGHSDGDVLTHAIIDSLLGAASLGDIGQHFPDTDMRYDGISSLILLKETRDKIRKAGYKVGNIDASIIMQRPRLAPYITEMRKNIINVLELSVDQINIKATTEETLGFTGDSTGVKALASCILYKE